MGYSRFAFDDYVFDTYYVPFSNLLGKTFTKIVRNKADEGLAFHLEDGEIFGLFHPQECSEHVYIESIVGDLEDLIGSPILLAEEVISSKEYDKNEPYANPVTYTFYKLATIKGYVDIRWIGSSNGYYSESVFLGKMTQN